MIHMKKRLYLHVNHKVGKECVVIFTYTASKYTLFGKKPFVNKFISLSSQCWITISALSTMSEMGSSWIGCFFMMCLLKFLFAVNLLPQWSNFTSACVVLCFWSISDCWERILACLRTCQEYTRTFYIHLFCALTLHDPTNIPSKLSCKDTLHNSHRFES